MKRTPPVKVGVSIVFIFLAKKGEHVRRNFGYGINKTELFHESNPDSIVPDTLEWMRNHQEFLFQIITECPKQVLKYEKKIEWSNNIMLGLRVRHKSDLANVDDLKLTGAKTLFLLIDPLVISFSKLPLRGIDWVIVGTGSGLEQPPEADLVKEIREQCIEHNVPLFFRNWGGEFPNRHNRYLEGREWSQLPEVFSRYMI